MYNFSDGFGAERVKLSGAAGEGQSAAVDHEEHLFSYKCVRSAEAQSIRSVSASAVLLSWAGVEAPGEIRDRCQPQRPGNHTGAVPVNRGNQVGKPPKPTLRYPSWAAFKLGYASKPPGAMILEVKPCECPSWGTALGLM